MNGRYIDADALRNDLEMRDRFGNAVYKIFQQLIDEQPTADVQKEIDYWHDRANSYEQTIVKLSNAIVRENVRGEWVGTEYDGYADGHPVFYEWECSACGCIVEDEEPTWNYCPNCGADMRGEE